MFRGSIPRLPDDPTFYGILSTKWHYIANNRAFLHAFKDIITLFSVPNVMSILYKQFQCADQKNKKKILLQCTQFISKYFQSTLGPIRGVKPLDTEGDRCEAQGYSQVIC